MTNTIQTIEQFKEQLEATQQFISNLDEQKQFLHDALSKVDQSQSDILHAIEFGKGKLDAISLIKLTVRLQDVLVERRKIKDMLEIHSGASSQLSFLSKNKGTIYKAVENVNKTCENHRKRKYKVKQLFDLKEVLPNSFR